MNFSKRGSISKKLAQLILLAVLPALVILFYSGLEQRRNSIARAKRDVLMLTHSMAQAQKEITNSTRQILSTLALLPAIQTLDREASIDIFRAVLEQNPNYNNILLVDLNGEVLASGRSFAKANLADRKHFREAVASRDFAVGEYILSRSGAADPVFAFAHLVLDKKGSPKAVLTTSISLASFSRFHDVSLLPEKSFVAITDHQGIRLFYFPAQGKTNPVGQPIRATSWEIANKTAEPGIFIGAGSDGHRRIFAFEQVRLHPDDSPYLYVWAGIPEARILAPANAALTRNVLLMLLATALALFISWLIAQKTLIAPIQELVTLARKFGQGDLAARSTPPANPDEFSTLTKAFHDMADALTESQRTLRDNEARFRLVMDSLDALVYVADMNTYEILFINKYASHLFGDITGKICWQTLQKGQNGPCHFCTNKYLLDQEGKPTEAYISEFQNTTTGKWFYMKDSAIEWLDGRLVRLQVATDITNRKKTEEERELLIAQLEQAAGKIKTLSGFLPICASCKMIRDDKGYWNQIESYIRDHSEAEFSHGICPDCAKKIYPDLVDDEGNFRKNDSKAS